MNGYVGSVSAPLAAGTRSAPSGMTDEEYRFEQPVSRVLKLFGLTVPALVIMLLTYIGLTEHVFGLSYALNRQMGRSFRRSLRVAYLLASSGAAALCHAVLLSRCALDGLEGVDSPLCPEVLLGERRCLAPSSMACLVAVLTLWVERVVAPALDLWGRGPYQRGPTARAIQASAVAVVWFSMAEQQLGAVQLLCMLSARRALVLFPRCSKGYGILMKLYTVLHMSRVLAYRCPGSRRLAVATTTAMLAL